MERTYNIPLRKEFRKAPRYRKAKKAVKAVREFLSQHMKVPIENVKLGKVLNEKIWERGVRRPPHHVKVTAVKEDDTVKAELFGHSYGGLEKVKEDKKEKPKEDKKEEEKKAKKKEKTEKKETKKEKKTKKKSSKSSKKKETKKKKSTKKKSKKATKKKKKSTKKKSSKSSKKKSSKKSKSKKSSKK